MKFYQHISVAFFSIFVVVASANASSAPYTKPCDSFKSPQAYVAKVAAYCLPIDNQQRCERSAEQYYEMCGFGEARDFRGTKEKLYKELLVRLVLNQTPSIMAVKQTIQ